MLFQAHVERLLDTKIKCIQSDWGGEYQKLYHQFFLKLGIAQRVSCPHTHQQNGSAERKHQHIVETGLALLAHASAPLKFWDEAFTTATYLINRLPTHVIDNLCPLECLFKTPPNYSMLQIFGCVCWPHLRPYNKHKLLFCSKPCVFIGYSSIHKGYKCLDMDIGRVYISRDIVFDENVFPFAKPSSNVDHPIQGSSSFNHDTNHLHNLFPANVSPAICPDAENTANAMRRSPASSNPTMDPGLLLDPVPISGNESQNPVDCSLHGSRQSQGLNPIDSSCDAATTGLPQSQGADTSIRASTSSPVQHNQVTVDPCGPQNQIDCNLHGIASVVDCSPDMIILSASDSAPEGVSSAEASDTIVHQYGTHLKNNIQRPEIRIDGSVTYLVTRTSSVEPSSHIDAMKHPLWHRAMQEEFGALIKNKTWHLVPPRAGLNIIDSKWVFKLKHKPDGSIDRYKACLVTKGFKQQYGVDYDDTFSPVVKPTTIQTLLSLTISQNWCLRQIDIQNALLHGLLNEDAYMK
jgi:hypothetical protein